MDYSALYVYIKSIRRDDSEYIMDAVDSLKYNSEDFFSNMQTNLNLINYIDDDGTDISNIFCICGTKEKIDSIKEILLTEIISRLTLGSNFEEKYSDNDIFTKFINTFTSYLLNNNLSPAIFNFNVDNTYFIYFFGSTKFLNKPPKNIKLSIETWFNKENPIVYGKQIVTEPFLYKNLIGRKALDIISNVNDNYLYLLLEGNIKIKLDYDAISSFSYSDSNKFTITDIQTVLYDPIYCFGYSFSPLILYREWFDIYLYVLAILDIDLNDTNKLKKSYNLFIDFIEKNICYKDRFSKPYFSEDTFYDILKKHIKNISNFIIGKEEFVISKNFILTIKNRWIYIEKFLQILSPIYKKEIKNLSSFTVFNQKEWKNLLKNVYSSNSYEKGRAMENVANYFLSCIKDIKILGRNIRQYTEEIDLCISNYSNNSLLWSLGSIILVECKNHKKNIPSKTIRNLSNIMDSKGIDTTILFTSSNLTNPALKEVDKAANVGKKFIIIYLKDLINLDCEPYELLKSKILKEMPSDD